MAYFARGGICGWVNEIACNAAFCLDKFCSPAREGAIFYYWKKRRTDVIDSMSFSSDVWLPVKVNKPMTAGQLTGNYALCWYIVKAKYKTGKSMSQRVHTIFHFDANDKIDRIMQYLDRVPINAAMAK